MLHMYYLHIYMFTYLTQSGYSVASASRWFPHVYLSLSSKFWLVSSVTWRVRTKKWSCCELWRKVKYRLRKSSVSILLFILIKSDPPPHNEPSRYTSMDGLIVELGSGFIMNIQCGSAYFVFIFTLLCKTTRIVHVYYCNNGCPTSTTFALAKAQFNRTSITMILNIKRAITLDTCSKQKQFIQIQMSKVLFGSHKELVYIFVLLKCEKR